MRASCESSLQTPLHRSRPVFALFSFRLRDPPGTRLARAQRRKDQARPGLVACKIGSGHSCHTPRLSASRVVSARAARFRGWLAGPAASSELTRWTKKTRHKISAKATQPRPPRRIVELNDELSPCSARAHTRARACVGRRRRLVFDLRARDVRSIELIRLKTRWRRRGRGPLDFFARPKTPHRSADSETREGKLRRGEVADQEIPCFGGSESVRGASRVESAFSPGRGFEPGAGRGRWVLSPP